MLSRRWLFLAVAFLPGYAAHSGEPVQPLPDVVARISGVEIARAQFETRIAQSRSMNPKLFDAMTPEERNRAIVRVLNAMILRELEVQEAHRRGIAISEEEVERQRAALEQTYSRKGGMKQALADFQITLEQWKQETRRNLMISKLEESAFSQIPVSEEEIREEFMRNFWHEKNPPSPKDLDEHREHMRMVIQARRWAERRKPWLESLVNAADIWRWTPVADGKGQSTGKEQSKQSRK